jgi:hypothetical protein
MYGRMSGDHAAVGLAELDAWPSKEGALQEVADRYVEHSRAAGLSERPMAAPIVAGCHVLYPFDGRVVAAVAECVSHGR